MIFSTVKSERHFVQIGCEMLCADFVPASDDAALQQRECRFDCVGVNVPLDVYAVLMLDGLVPSPMNASFHHGFGISHQFVCDHHVNISTNVLFDELREGSRLRILGMEESEIAATLANPDYDFLVGCVRSTPTLLNSTDIGFVHLNSTFQYGTHFFHSCTNAMAEIPCGLVRASVKSPKGALNLVSGHSLSGFAKQVSSSKPFNQGQVRVVEDRIGSNCELVIAFGAVQQLRTICEPDNVSALTADALRTIRPAQTLKQFAASIISRKEVADIN